MSVSKMPRTGAVKASVTIPAGKSYSVLKNTAYKFPNGLLSGLIEIRIGSLSARTWTHIGTINCLPAGNNYQGQVINSANGTFAGMSMIDMTTGAIEIYLSTAFSGSSDAANINVNYLSQN